jgi:hypothetical protein
MSFFDLLGIDVMDSCGEVGISIGVVCMGFIRLFGRSAVRSSRIELVV